MRSPSSPRAAYPSSDRSFRDERNDSSPSPPRNAERFYVQQGGGRFERADRANGPENGVLANPEGAVQLGQQLGPILRAEDLPIVNGLVGGLLGLRETHARFKDVEDNQVLRAANCFARYKMRPSKPLKGLLARIAATFSTTFGKYSARASPRLLSL